MNAPKKSPLSRSARKTALLIGVSTYDDGSRIPDLPGADCNPLLLEPQLQGRGFSCATLLNEKAKRADIEQAIRNLIGAAQPGDVCLIAYSGHGNSIAAPNSGEPDGANEFIYPHDSGAVAAIRDDDLALWLGRARPDVSIYCVFDACHSGTMDGFLSQRRSWWQRMWRLLRRIRRWFRPRDAGRRVMVFSACRDDEEADYSQRLRGRFTDALLNAMRCPTVVTNRDLGEHIAHSVGSGTDRQHPQFHGPERALRAAIFEPFFPDATRSPDR